MSQAKGNNNFERLTEWVKKTPLNKVPRNRVGGACRSTICAELEISRSTVTSNPKIGELFNGLDASLKKVPAPDKKAEGSVAIAVLGRDLQIRALNSELTALRLLLNDGMSLEAP
ncbi:hypothetical protein [Roseateles koreensis]|uniref:Transposase n=1 Tax=Roseateles koreensis TaxID=2987526 RepID=A0ABT5KTR9_9BURK|nr:hypothetical protein [Roseateles koreensis]MDC8786319.1 hypothetical protein [Roseateles koreensis]